MRQMNEHREAVGRSKDERREGVEEEEEGQIKAGFNYGEIKASRRWWSQYKTEVMSSASGPLTQESSTCCQVVRP